MNADQQPKTPRVCIREAVASADMTPRVLSKWKQDNPAYAANVERALQMLRDGDSKEEILSAVGRFVYQDAVDFALKKR